MTDKAQKKSNIVCHYIQLFLLLIILEVMALAFVALIPRSYIKKNLEQSANYLCEKDVFFYASSTDKATKIDRYADSILLNITYYYNEVHPVSSVMSSSYYFTPTNNENYNLLTAVTNELSPTLEYSRYWHGSIAIVRPLLILFDIEEIYIFICVILAFMLLALLILIAKQIGKAGAFCFIAATIMTSMWYVPMSLEYTWTILIMLITSIITLLKLKSNHCDFTILFLTVGNITAYFDFLTTETLTFLVPAVLIITYNYTSGKIISFSKEFKSLTQYGIIWFIGYIFTHLAKWTLASIILKRNIFLDAFNQAKYRAVGQADELSFFSQRIGAEARNISNLFPFSTLGSSSLIFAIVFFAFTLSVIFLIRKEKNCFNHLLLIIAVIPYIRYFVLGNHSYLHHFFTFRAQFATIFCLGLIITYGSDRILIAKEWKKLWKKKSN